MPETFNFTARATAASGAFADRNFSITVNNSIIQRLLAVGPSGAARSLGAGQPWVLIPGITGDSGDFGDRWLVWDQTAGLMRASPDLINWSSFVPTLPAGITTLSFLRWRTGAWWAMASADRTSHWEHGVVTSTNGGQTWSLVGGTVTSAGLGFSFERSAAGASIIATDTEWHFRASDGAAWAVARTTGHSYKFQIAHLNGIWFAPASQASYPGVSRSTDGSTWFDQSNASVLTSGYYRGAAYANGVVLAYAYADTQAGYTTDAGLTFQAITTPYPAAPGAYQAERPIVAQGGSFVLLGPGGSTYLLNNVILPSSTQALPAPLGVPACLAVRN
jgi:hypothetical protein